MGFVRLDPRGFWFTMHQWAGLAGLVFLIVVGATGSALTYRWTVDRWLNPDLFNATAQGQALAPGELVRRVEGQRPGMRVSYLFLGYRPGRAAVMSVEPRAEGGAKPGYDQVFADPVDGRVLGQREQFRTGWSARHLVYGMHMLHAELLGGTIGRWLLGIISGLWAVSSLIGLYLTLPKTGPFWKKWKAMWTVKPGSKLPRFLLDLHRASGLWLLLAAVPVGVTGCALNFFEELSEPAALALSPSKVPQMNAEVPPAKPLPPPRLGYGEAIARAAELARAEGRGMVPAVASYEADEGLYRVGVTRSGIRDYAGYGPVYFYIDATNGRLAFKDDPYRDSAGRAFIRSLYPVHTGEVFGWLTRLMVFLLGFAVVEMCVSGAYLWWKKQSIQWKARKAARAKAAAAA